MNWTLKKARYLINDKWLKLKTCSYLTKKGLLIEPYYIYEFPDWVNIVAITEYNEVILTRQYRPGIDKVLLELPSGWINNGETPEESIKRELLEETGYLVDKIELMGTVSPNPSSHTNLNHCFFGTNAKKVQEQDLDEAEQIEVVLLPVAQLEQLAKSGKFIQALHVSAIFFALQKINTI